MDEVILSREHGIATLTINRPQQRNAITQTLWQALPTLCAQIHADANVRVVVVRGAGREAFSAGGDIGEFALLRSNRTQAEAYNRHVEAALDALQQLDKVTIALIHGACMGGGLMLACACDLRLASAEARFAVPVARLGGLLTSGQLQLFTGRTGAAHTAELVLTGRTLSATEAQAVGLCSQIEPPETLDQNVAELAARLTAFAPLTQNAHKQLLRALGRGDVTQLHTLESSLADLVYNSADYAEGTRAFVEKRQPRFAGA